jgi:hypothetical protein
MMANRVVPSLLSWRYLAGGALFVETTTEAVLHAVGEGSTRAPGAPLAGLVRSGYACGTAGTTRSGDGEDHARKHHQKAQN